MTTELTAGPHGISIQCQLPLASTQQLQLVLEDRTAELQISRQLCPQPSHTVPSHTVPRCCPPPSQLVGVQVSAGSVGVCSAPLFGPLSSQLVEQWVEYHLLLGVERIVLFDRDGVLQESYLHEHPSAVVVQWPLFTPRMHHPSRLTKYYDQVHPPSAPLLSA